MAVDTQILPPRYRSPRPIGHGAMGDIYLATDDVLGREVVVKVLGERYASDEGITARFKREAFLLVAALHHLAALHEGIVVGAAEEGHRQEEKNESLGEAFRHQLTADRLSSCRVLSGR